MKPHFENRPPRWVLDSKLCERESFQTGFVIKNSKYTRTGNVLLERKMFNTDNTKGEPFNPRFGKTGGRTSIFSIG